MLKWLLASLAVIGSLTGALGLAAEASGPQVVGGSATIQQSGNNLTVTTGSNRTIINWNTFGVPQGGTANFIQPGSNSAVLNRVTGGLPSRIDGSLLSNGRVYLINPSGVVVGATGVINTAGFTASTLDIPDSAFLGGGDLRFVGSSNEAIVNLGTIEASEGNIFLIAAKLENQGTLKAANGTVGLIAAKDVILTANNQVFIQPVNETVGGTGIENSGVIEAAKAELQAQGNLYQLAINNTGTVNATSVVEEGGRILLRADGGKISNTGNLTAQRVVGGKTIGGTIEILAEIVDLNGNAVLNASGELGGGQINIGGSKQGQGPLPNAKITFVGNDVQIFADALDVGNGGTVIVWSNDRTYFGGKIYARGGANGGDGGFVETSGKNMLYVANGATVNTIAELGIIGQWLLDPRDITVDGAGAAGLTAVDQFGDTPSTDLAINAATINGAATAVTLQATRDVIINTAIGITTASVTLTIQAGRDVLINANVATNNAAISITANDHTAADSANRTDNTAGDITMAVGTSISSGTGSITLIIDQDTSGNYSPGIITARALSTNGGGVTLNSAQGITLNGNISTDNAGAGATAGAVAVTGPITLGAGVTIDTDASATDANITINTSVDGSFSLTLTAGGGAVSTGDVGGTTSLTTLSITANTIGLGNVTTSGAQSYTGATTLNGTLSVDTAGAGVTVTGATSLAAGGGAITLTGTNAANDVSLGTVNGAQALNITAGGGDVTLGVVGGTTALTSVTVSAGTIGLQAVTTSGAQSYTGATTLNGTLTVNAAGAGVTVTGATSLAAGSGAITLTGTNAANDVSLGTVNGTQALNITAGGGDVTLGAVGGTTALTSVTVSAGTIGLQAVTTSGAQSYTGATTLNGTLTVNTAGAGVTVTGATSLAAGGGAITLTGTNAANDVSLGTVNGAQALNITAGGGDVTLGVIGGSTALTAVTVSANTIGLQAVTTSGAQSYTGTTTLNGTLTVNASGAGVTVTGATSLAAGGGAITLTGTNAANDVSLGTVNGAQALNITAGGGDVAVGVIGGTTPVLTMTVQANTLSLSGNVSVAGNGNTGGVNLSGVTTITLLANVVIDTDTGGAGNAGNLNLGTSAVTGSGFSLQIDTTASGGGSDGTIAIGSVGTSGGPLSGVTLSGGALTLNGSIFVDNAVLDFSNVGAITLGGSVTLDTDNSATSGTNAGNVIFNQTINGGFALTIDASANGGDSFGTVTFGADLGGTTNLTTLSVTGLTININGGTSAVQTTGAQTYTGNVALGADTSITGVGIIFNNNISNSAARDLTINGGTGIVTITGTVGAGTALGVLTVNSSNTVTFGSTVAAASLVTDATGTTRLTGNVTTSAAGGQVYNDDVVLLGNVLITTSSDLVTFAGKVDGAFNLTVDTGGSGTVTFTGAVGSGTALSALTVNTTGTTLFSSTVQAASLTTNAGGITQLNGNVTTSGTQSYGDNLEINANITLQTTNNNVTFSGTVNSQTTTDRNLTVSVGSGNISFGNAVGGGNDLGNFTFTTTGTLTINQNITATGTGTINTGGLLTISAGTITVPNLTLNPSATGVTQSGGSLVVSGTLTLQGTGDFDLNGPTANNAGTLVTSGSSITSVDYRDSNALTLGALQTSGNINIRHDTGVLSIGNNITITGTGTFTEDAASTGSVTITATSTIQTNGQNITFDNAITLNDGFTLNLTTGGGGTAGAITFTTVNDQNATADTTLNLTAASFTYTGIGNSNKLQSASLTTGNTSGMTISSGTANANNLSFTTTSTNATANLTLGSALTADTITLDTQQTLALNENITAITGTATLTIKAKAVTQSGTKTVDVNNLVLQSQNGNGSFSINSTTNVIDNVSTSGAGVAGSITLVSVAPTTTLSAITTTNSGNLSVDHGSNTLTISGTQSIAGNFSETGTGGVNLQINLTAAGSVTFNNVVTVSGSRSVQGSSVTFANNVLRTAGTDDLTVTSTAGDVTFSGNVGTNANRFDILTISVSGGSVVQGSGKKISADNLTLTVPTVGGGTTLALDTTTTALSGTITDGGANNAFQLTNTGAFTIAGTNLNATTSVLTLNGTGLSGSGLVTASKLELLSSGNVSLTTSVGTLAANLSGGSTLSVSNNASLTIGTAGGTTGITTSNATATAVSITTTGGTSNLTLASSVSVGAGGGVSLTAGQNLDLGSNVGFAGRDLTIAKTGTFSATGAVTANTLTVNGSGNYTIDTTITTLARSSGGGSGTIAINETDTLTIGTCNGSGYTIAIKSGGDITNSGTLTANSLAINSAGNVTITTAVGNFAAELASGKSLVVNNTGTLNITTVTVPTVIDATGAISGITTSGGGDVTITSSNGVSQAAGAANLISTDVLTVNGTGNFIMNNTSNAVGHLTTGSGSLAVTGNPSQIQITVNASGIILDEIETTGVSGNLTVTTSGTVTVNGPLQLSGSFSQVGGGGVSLSGTLSAPSFDYSGAVTIANGTSITATSGGIHFGSTVDGAVAGASVTMVAAINNNIVFDGPVGTTTALGTIGLTTTGTGQVVFNDVVGDSTHRQGSITISSAAAFTSSKNIFSSGTVDITASGITQSAGTIDALVAINFRPTTNGVSQTGGSLVTAGLGLIGTGGATGFQMTAGTNTFTSLTSLGGATTGTVSITTTSIVSVGAFDAGTAATVNLNVGGTTAGGLLTAGTLNLTSSGNAALSTSITTLTVSMTTAGSTLSISEANGLAIGAGGVGGTNANITISLAAGTLTSSGTISGSSLNLLGAGTSYTVNTAVGTLTGNLTFGGAGTLTVNETDALVLGTLTASTFTVNITSTGLTGGTLTAAGLVTHGSGGVSITTSIGKFESDATGAISVTNAGSLTIGGVSGTNGVSTNSTIFIRATSGTLTISETVTTTGTSTTLQSSGLLTISANIGALTYVTLNAGGIDQTAGVITTVGLEILGSGVFDLNGSSANMISNLAVNIGSPLDLKNGQALTVGTVNGTTGISTNNGDLILTTTSGQINLAANVNVGTARATFNGAAGTNQTSGTLTSNELVLGGSGPVSLTTVTNSISSLGGTIVGGTGSTVDIYAGSGNLAIANLGAGANGLTTSGNAITIRAPNGVLTVNAPLNSTVSGSGTATTIGQVVVNVIPTGGATITLEGAPNPGGGGGGGTTIILQPFQPPNQGPPLGLGGLGALSLNTNSDLSSIGSLGVDDLKKDDLGVNLDNSIANLKFEKLGELMKDISTLIENQGGDNASLRRSLEEVKNSEQIMNSANDALEAGSKAYGSAGDPLKAILKQLIGDVQKAGEDVKNANLTLAQKLASFTADRMDRLAEDALEGAIAGLRNANDRLRVAAVVLHTIATGIAEGKLTANNVDEIMQLIDRVRAEESMKAQNERDRRDRLKEDQKFAELQDIGKDEQKPETKTEETPQGK